MVQLVDCWWPLLTTEANAAAASKLQHVHDADKTALVRYVLPLKPPCLDAKDSYPTSYPILTMGWGELMSLASGEWLVTMVTSSKMSISGSRSSWKQVFFTSDCYKDPGQSVEYWCLESRLAFPWSSWSTCCGSSGALIVNCSLNTNLTSLLLKNNFRLIVCLLFNFTAWFLW